MDRELRIMPFSDVITLLTIVRSGSGGPVVISAG